MFGDAAIALMNTDRSGVDHLADDRWLAAALPGWGVAAPGRIDAADLVELRELRTLLRHLTEIVARGDRLGGPDLIAFNKVLAATPVRAQLAADGERYVIDMTPVTTGWREYAIREVAGSFSAILRADPSRLKICAAAGCGTVFWDQTRSRSRTWCDSRSCGNRMRVQRHRARQG
jgi:predicted RNA-binding Zn ribbon-like protein